MPPFQNFLLTCLLAILLFINKSTSSTINEVNQFENQSNSLFSTKKESNYEYASDASDVQNDVKNSLNIDAHSNQEASADSSSTHRIIRTHVEQTDQHIDKNETEKWSDWSDCSADCGIGIQTQRLETNADFSSIKYKVCKKQDCDSSQESLRQRQCSHFDRITYTDGQHYFWKATLVPTEPCALYCEAYLRNATGNLVHAFKSPVKLQDWLVEGTGCSEDEHFESSSLCINNKCMYVDCELNLNGRLQVDACGVCGGDNSTCDQAAYQDSRMRVEYVWRYADYGECIPDCNQDDNRLDIDATGLDDTNNGASSSSLTLGFQTSYPLCFKHIHHLTNHHARKHSTEHVTTPNYCDQDLKPSPQIRSCENFVYHCKPKWITKEWTNCSVNCGIGHQKRDIYCGLISRLTKSDGSPEQILRVDSLQCTDQQRPSMHRQCESFDCSNWFTGPWSECSISCGQGVQIREVTCRDKDGQLSTDCKLNLKPGEQQLCKRECESVEEFGLKDQPDVGWRTKVSNSEVGEEPTWVASEWSGCSSECGKGMQQRIVECKMLFKFSGTVATLPEDQCHHEARPVSEQTCNQRPCDEENEIDQPAHFSSKQYKNSARTEDREPSASEPHHSTTLLDSSVNEISNRNDDIQSNNFNDFFRPYMWIIAGFTDCTAQCLGGTQDSLIQCVHRSNSSELPASYCDLSTRPDYVTRTCNDKPCPPRWNEESQYGPCSRECGKGIQTREIKCIHEVTRGEENVIQLPNSNCSHPPPPTTRFCAVHDCESRWVAGKWSACKRQCGKMAKHVRSVKCFKLLAHGEDSEVTKIHCKDKRRPKSKKKCVSRVCIPPKVQTITAQQNKSLNQTKKLQPKTEQTNKYSLDNSIGYKRTHIDFKKLENDQRKWKEINKFIASENEKPVKKNQTSDNWKKIIESNSIDEQKGGRWSKASKINHKNYKNELNIYNNNLNNDINQNSHLNKCKFEGMTTSGSTDGHNSVITQLHHLQKLLTKLLTRKSIPKKSEKSLKLCNETQESAHDLETNEVDNCDEDELLANNIVENLLLTETGIKNLVFDWMISDWSSCSVDHGTGFQIRGLQCMVKLYNTTKAVNEAMCLNAGLLKPLSIKRCTKWEVKDWSPCKFCIRRNTGIQTRIVQCIEQGTQQAISSRLCDSNKKPEHRQECHNPCNPLEEELTQTMNSIIVNNEEEIDEERTDDRLY